MAASEESYGVTSSTTSADFIELTEKLRTEFANGRTRSVEYRKEQLRRLYDFLNDNQKLIVEALKQDLRKPWFETIMVEVDFVLNEIRGTLQNIEQYVSRKAVSKSIPTLFDEAFVWKEPYGLVLIIGAWNYPIQIILGPLVGAIAAGKCGQVQKRTKTNQITTLPFSRQRRHHQAIRTGPC